MRKTMLKALCLITAALMLAAVIPCAALAETTAPKEILSGSCGNNLTWTFDTDTGALNITGTGSMTSKPWSSFKESIITLTLGAGVTSICSDAFYYCEALTTVIGGSGVTSIGDRAFYYCTALTSITIPEGITEIGDSVFAYCTSLPSVTIPEGVTNINRRAFYSCGSLESLVIPDNVRSIGDSAFHSCDSLTSVSIGSGVISIDREAFSFCRALPTVNIPASVRSIGYCAFQMCSSMTSAVFAGSPPTSFDELVFEGCAEGFAIVYDPAYANQWAPNGETTWNGYPIVSGEGMSSGHLGDNLAWEFNAGTGVLSITGTGEMAAPAQFPWEGFADEITGVVIGQGVTSIAPSAFRGMSALVSVSAANTVLTIGDSAFRDCTSIVAPQLPGVTTVGDNAFRGCTALERMGCPSVVNYGSYAYCGCVSLWEINNNYLTSIGEGCFKDCTSIKTLHFPEQLTAVPDHAFENCSALYFVGWGEDSQLVSIGSRAFAGTALTFITFPESLASVSSNAFADCPTLTTAVFSGNPPASFGSGVFTGAYPRFSVVFDSAHASAWSSFGSTWNGYTLVSSANLVVGWCDGGALWNINSVTGVMTVYADYSECSISTRPGFAVPWDNYRTVPTDIVVGRGVIEIGQDVFQNFTRVTNVKLAEGLLVIGGSAFQGCSKLEMAVIPDTVETLGYGVFKNCVKLGTAVIPDSVTSCGEAVFQGCTSVTSAAVGRGLPRISGSMFSGCTMLSSVTLPEGIAAININAFFNCTSLASITIPASVTTLGDSVFQGCTRLESIVLPASLTSLGSQAFTNCTSLTSIIFRGDTPTSVGWDPFYGCTSALTLYYYAAHADSWSPNGETTWQGRPIVMLGNMPGDVDGDFETTVADALLALRASMGLVELNNEQQAAANVDGDEEITVADALLILRASMGLLEL